MILSLVAGLLVARLLVCWSAGRWLADSD